MQVIQIPGIDSSSLLKVRLYKFEKVEAPSQLLKKVQSLANPYVLLDGPKILNYFHLKLALFSAYNRYLVGTMKTKTLESEVLFALEPTKKIKQSFHNFGVHATSPFIFILQLGYRQPKRDGIQVLEELGQLVQKDPIAFESELQFFQPDLNIISEIYGLERGLSVQEMEKFISSSIAIKPWL